MLQFWEDWWSGRWRWRWGCEVVFRIVDRSICLEGLLNATHHGGVHGVGVADFVAQRPWLGGVSWGDLPRRVELRGPLIAGLWSSSGARWQRRVESWVER
jgi:hypothetical protein